MPSSSTSGSHLIPTQQDLPQLISLNASTQIPVKLSKDGSNFSSWKSQLTNLLFGYNLLGYVDGSTPCPASSDANYSFWQRQDRLILLALQSTVAVTLSPIINVCTTSASAWTKLQTSFANSSTTRMLSLLSSLMTTKKAGRSVADYMATMRTFIDDLATIDHPQSTGQIASYVLNGLGGEYKDLVGALRVQSSPPTFEQLRDFLIDAEILAGDQNLSLDIPISAQYTQCRGRPSNPRGRGRSQGSLPSRHHHGFGSASASTGDFNNRSSSSVICQLCDKSGHSAKNCYSHFPPAANATSTSVANPTTPNWLLDTGATHHITSDLNNLQIHSDYNGPDSVMLGDGSTHGGILGPRPE
ncbi:unnamed protein product [Cuscuta epithymum]|uniref:Retrotransposon Copia-like N-terminal domain-containing protein n=1 Tax=Cuscuta epithymum TaxID=186058 RepID=A0AAV0CKY9_9ASTE|nr:unnamed protein product [Cuscuta epithymum]